MCITERLKDLVRRSKLKPRYILIGIKTFDELENESANHISVLDKYMDAKFMGIPIVLVTKENYLGIK